MTGAEHYQAAERLLADAARWERDVVDDLGSYASIDSARRAAQAHATLALAAATAITRTDAVHVVDDLGYVYGESFYGAGR